MIKGIDLVRLHQSRFCDLHFAIWSRVFVENLFVKPRFEVSGELSARIIHKILHEKGLISPGYYNTTKDIIFSWLTLRLSYCLTCLHRIFSHFEGIQFHSAPRISSRAIFSKGAIKINFYLKYWSTNFFVRCKILSHFEITKFIVFILFWHSNVIYYISLVIEMIPIVSY